MLCLEQQIQAPCQLKAGVQQHAQTKTQQNKPQRPPPHTRTCFTLPDETIAGLLSTRPVDVTFEALPEPGSEPLATAAPTAPAVPAAAPAAAAPRKRAPAKPKATKGKKAPKAKKAAKVTTVRKAFKVQSRGPGGGQEKSGSGGGRGGGGGGGAGGGGGGAGAAAPAYTVPTLPASTTTAAI